MTTMTSQERIEAPSTAGPLATVMAVIFTGYFVIGIAMPVLPLHVHQGLGYGTFLVGIVAGSQFAASLISRFTAGHLADSRGAKRVVIAGLMAGSAAGVLYLMSIALLGTPALSLTVLLLGRALLGGAESFMVAGALNWGLALAGQKNAGRVMAWVGTAMYVAFAAGAPVGSFLYSTHGFMPIALATILIPLINLLLVASLDHVPGSPHARPAVLGVLSAVWLPGLGLALSSVGFGAITTFIVLLFARNGWTAAWIALTAVSTAFVLGRVLFGHLPDRIDGPRIALICILIEAAGQSLVWLASTPALAFAGAGLAGLGYSLVYPAFGVEAVRRVLPENRGLAMGAYTASLDLALGVSAPILGLVAGEAGLDAVFLASALIVLCATGIALWLIKFSNSQESVE